MLQRARAATTAVAFLMVAAAVVMPSATRSDSFELQEATLEKAVEGMGVVWTGSTVYAFGGAAGGQGAAADIYRYNHPDGPLEKLSTSLLSGVGGASAVWGGDRAYLFGGDGAAIAAELRMPTDWIQAYDPDLDTTGPVGALLPLATTDLSAVWLDGYAYLFGGHAHDVNQDPVDLDTIHRYDPVTDTLTTMTATLPSGRYSMAAASDGTFIYLFGGAYGYGQADPDHHHVDDILRSIP